MLGNMINVVVSIIDHTKHFHNTMTVLPWLTAISRTARLDKRECSINFSPSLLLSRSYQGIYYINQDFAFKQQLFLFPLIFHIPD